ncbi:MAG TPA: DUF2062 domain-containing protein [Chthoniobacterales bacterium]|nr:DUF2062 domain-containing protein [Chthoniobacterales bacterium]
MRIPNHWQRRFFRVVPRRRHLRGGRLHRVLGERLFRPELWALTAPELAKGVALGLFIGCTPTMGVQIVLCGVAAFLLRVNVPIALLATLISNPFTAPILYPMEYQLGVWFVGIPEAEELEGFSGGLRNFVRYARPLWAGSIVTGAICGAAGYALVWVISRVSRVVRRRSDADRRAAAEKR